jgi:hypothetical protein
MSFGTSWANKIRSIAVPRWWLTIHSISRMLDFLVPANLAQTEDTDRSYRIALKFAPNQTKDACISFEHQKVVISVGSPASYDPVSKEVTRN